MPRVFASLAIAEIIVLLITGGVGFAHLDPNGDRHVLLAVFAALLSCLIQVVLFTYFSVAGKMIAQAVHLGQLPTNPIPRLQRLKRSIFHCLALVIASVVLVTISGARHWSLGNQATTHLTMAGILLVAHGFLYYRQYSLVCRGSSLLNETLQAYQRVRAAKDSPVDMAIDP